MFTLFVLLGVVYLAVTLYTYPRYQAEINQKLNWTLAQQCVAQKGFVDQGIVHPEVLDKTLDMIMEVNPNIEAYLLDAKGVIVAHSTPPEKLRRRKVSLTPINIFLNADRSRTIEGDDPRSVNERKVFSVAPVYMKIPNRPASSVKDSSPGKLLGYLYLVLGSESYDTVAGLLRDSYIVRLIAAIIGGSILFALAAGLLLFSIFMRRLKTLMAAMEAFKSSDFSDVEAARMFQESDPRVTDPVAGTFNEMAARIVEQMLELRKVDSMRRELIANVSHDLRTPVAALRAYIETLIMRHGKLTPEDERRLLETASRQSETLSSLVERLFELAKLELDAPSLDIDMFSITELAEDVVQKMSILAEVRGVTLRAEHDASLHPVRADAALLERALDNLIENSIRNTPAQGQVRIVITRRERVVRIEVIDTGVGIPSEEIPFIFDRYYKGLRPRTPRDTGTGLGLAIARQIVQLHGGTIAVESKAGAGTVVTLEAPIGAE